MHGSGSDTLVQKEISDLKSVVSLSSKSTTKISIVAIIISTLAMIFSCVSVYYSAMDDISDAKWMELQSKKLQELIDSQKNNTLQLGTRLDSLILTSKEHYELYRTSKESVKK
jgi:hypothetical protein